MKKITRKVNNKLRGAFGQTDFKNGTVTIEINKKLHKNKKVVTRTPKKDRTLLNSIVHEELHAAHEKMHEDTVRKKARRKVSKLSKKQKKKLYQRYV